MFATILSSITCLITVDLLQKLKFVVIKTESRQITNNSFTYAIPEREIFKS